MILPNDGTTISIINLNLRNLERLCREQRHHSSVCIILNGFTMNEDTSLQICIILNSSVVNYEPFIT